VAGNWSDSDAVQDLRLWGLTTSLASRRGRRGQKVLLFKMNGHQGAAGAGKAERGQGEEGACGATVVQQWAFPGSKKLVP
jgi:hypothetical protein